MTSPDYLDELGERSAAEVRSMRDECREEESRLSYARRLLHGQLDVARAELARRSSPEARSLVESLGEVLKDPDAPAAPRSASRSEVYVPSGPEGRRQGDRVLDQMPLGRLPDLDDAELTAAVERLAAEERHLSTLRRTVLDHLDRLQSELVTRYRSGGTSIDEAIAPSLPDG